MTALRDMLADPHGLAGTTQGVLKHVVRESSTAKALTRHATAEYERLLQGAQALATRLPCFGMAPDLAGMPLDDLRGAYRFLERAAGGT